MLFLALTSMLSLGCRVGSPRQLLRVDVTVTDDAGDALAGVSLAVDEVVQQVATDAAGRASLSLSAPPGRRLRVAARCPEAYRASEARTLSMAAASRLELRFQCRPKLRTLAVVVNAPRAEGLTMRADGEPIGKVGADGTLHAVLKRAPEAELRLMLDTGGAPQLRPQNPVEDIVVPDRDEIVVFDHALAPVAVRRPRLAAPVAKPEASHIPYAIGRR